MTGTDTDWFSTGISQLNDPQNLRIWSIIVSLFGDLAQKPGDRISGGALTQIITPMGIKPEAIRVALHRLRKDGWIESARSGRASVHFLTDYGRSQSAAVTPRIYARAPQPPENWHLLIAEDQPGQNALEELLLLPQYVAINRTTALGHGDLPGPQDDLFIANLSKMSVPGWLKDRLFPQDLITACEHLNQSLSRITLGNEMSPQQIATMRTLIVHHWRRIALRCPELPEQFHPRDWRGKQCRNRVFELLDNLPQPSAAALNQTEDT